MNHPAMSQSTPLFPNLGALAGTPAALPASDMELQKMLIDERMRCEHHKTNYQTLKAEHTRLELENRISELEQQRALQEAAGSSQKEEWEERLRAAQLGEETARREAHSLRVEVQQQGLQQDELTREKQENEELRLRNQEMSVQLGTLGRSEAELLEANHRLREMLDRLKEELRTARSQAEKAQHEAERALEEQRVEWLEEKHKLQERDTELQEKYSQAKERLQRAALAQKNKPSDDLFSPEKSELGSQTAASATGVCSDSWRITQRTMQPFSPRRRGQLPSRETRDDVYSTNGQEWSG
ncbi:centrosomal protein of 83 kDa-like isoform X2 [Anguilla rostrata]